MAQKVEGLLEACIRKGRTEGQPTGPLNGRGIKFISVPETLAGGTFTIVGTFDGTKWFQVMSPAGGPVRFSITAASPTRAPDQSDYNQPIRVLTVPQPDLFKGLAFIAPVATVPQTEDLLFEFYCS